MARQERNITIKVIENKKINTNKLVDYFAKKYSEKNIEGMKEKRKKKEIL